MSKAEIVVNYFHNEFKKSSFAKDYAKSRGITKESIIKWRIGYAPTYPKYCYRFKDRLIFPIWDQQNILVGWTGRTLVNASRKYDNVKESQLFKKKNLLYGYNFAISSIYKTQAAVLCEGQMDTVLMHQFGITNAVASSGTASFGGYAARLLARYARNVFIVFDGDDAGAKATLAAEKYLYDAGVGNIIPVQLEKGEDPASILIDHGKTYYLRLLYNAKQRKATSGS